MNGKDTAEGYSTNRGLRNTELKLNSRLIDPVPTKPELSVLPHGLCISSINTGRVVRVHAKPIKMDHGNPDRIDETGRLFQLNGTLGSPGEL